MRNIRLGYSSMALIVGLATGSSLPAATMYVTTLLGSNEVPPSGAAGTGTSVVTLNGNLLTVNESYSGLSGSVTGAHIHCCGLLGLNEPVAVPFTNFPTTTAGTFMQTFDLTLTATYTAGFLTASGGTAAAAEAALIAGLNSGQTYANIHTGLNPGGEIRGQLAPTVPEPTSAGLMLFGLTPIAYLLGRRAKK